MAKLEVRGKEELLKALQSSDREKRKGAFDYLAANKDPELLIFLLKASPATTGIQVVFQIDSAANKTLALKIIGAMNSEDGHVISAFAFNTDPSQSPEVTSALMDHPSRAAAHILAYKISPQTSPDLARKYLYSNESWIARAIAGNIDPSQSPEFAAEMMRHNDPKIRLTAVQKLDAATDFDLIERGLGSGNYEDVRRESAAKVPANDARYAVLYAKARELFPVTADSRRRMEESGISW